MTSRQQRVAWGAPLLVGASGAIAGEVAIGILLYAGPGLMRSLTTILAVEGAAFAAGLWLGPAMRGNEVERLRLRWLFCLAAFAAAALFGTAWSVIEDVGGGRWGQGLGLAVLAALPLYASGLVLGGMGAITTRTGLALSAGPPAALGAALGFVITGFLLPRAPIPSSLLVACLVMLSAAGLIFGVALGARPVVHLRALRSTPTGDVRVEDHVTGGGGEVTRYLLEGGCVRIGVELDGNGSLPWDVAVAQALLGRRTERGGSEAPARVLSLGGGVSSLARALAEWRPDAQLDVLERSESVVELARDHLETGLDVSTMPGVRIEVGNLEDLLAEARDPYDVVLVDARALAPVGGTAGLSRAARAALFAVARPSGVVAWGPLPGAADDALEVPPGWELAPLPHGVDSIVLIRAPATLSHAVGVGSSEAPNAGPSAP